MADFFETEPRLREISDSEIVLNFARAMTSLYPHMKAVYAHCYDPYDSVVEPLFHALVYGAFGDKYGVPVPAEECHTYDSVADNYERLSHIEVRPRSLPLQIQESGRTFEITEGLLLHKKLVFKTFGDGLHNLTGGEDEGDYDVTFHLTEVQVLDLGAQNRQRPATYLWVPNDAVEYKFVLNPHARRE
jgi:hypothetical protein